MSRDTLATSELMTPARLALTAAAGLGALGAYYVMKLKRRARRTPTPNYGNADSWFMCERTGTKAADLFYAHPTTEFGLFGWNIPFDDYNSSGKLKDNLSGDPDLIASQAGAFRDSCNVWAPRYSQMGILAQAQNLSKEDPELEALK